MCRLPSPGGLRQSKKERTRAALVEAAVRLVRERGYEATTVDLIAGAADVSVRTFHNYFAGKPALFAEAAVGFIDEFADALAAQPLEGTCLEAMCAAWLELLDEHGADLDDHRGMLEVLESHPEIKLHLLESAPETFSRIRAEVTRRTSLSSPDSIAAWVGGELAFSTAGFVLRAAELGIERSEDPVGLVHEAFSGIATLAEPRAPVPPAATD